MASESASAVKIRLGRHQTPYRYVDLETVQRDLTAAQLRVARLRKDLQRAVIDAGKLAEGYTRLAEKQEALAEARRARQAAKRAATTSPETESDG